MCDGGKDTEKKRLRETERDRLQIVRELERGTVTVNSSFKEI